MSSKQSDEVMSSCLSATSGPSVEGMSPSEASRVLSRRRTLLRLLDLETRLVENEIRRLRGAGATTPSSAASVSRETPERRTSPQAPSRRSSAGSQIAMERLELASVSASRCSSPIGGLEVGSREGAISPRPSLTPRPSSAMRSQHSSRTSRSTSSGERHASRLPRSLVQQLAEREIQEAARQLEALRLRGSAQQREMQMRAQALQTQTQVVLAALHEIRALEKRNKRKPGSISLETLRRWIHDGWLAGTERELQRLKLGLSSSRLRQKRAEFEPSVADLTLIEVQNQRREEQLASLHIHFQKTYFQNGSHFIGQKERALRTVEERDTEVLRLRREVAARRRQAQEQRGLLLALNRRNQQLTRQALSLEQQHQNSDAANANIKMVTEYVCLKQREKDLRKDLTTWERRKSLLNTQLQSARRKKNAVTEPVTVPQCTPTGSEIQGEVNSVSHHEQDEQETEAHIASTTSAQSDSTSESSRSRRQSTSSVATSSSRNFR